MITEGLADGTTVTINHVPRARQLKVSFPKKEIETLLDEAVAELRKAQNWSADAAAEAGSAIGLLYARPRKDHPDRA